MNINKTIFRRRKTVVKRAAILNKFDLKTSNNIKQIEEIHKTDLEQNQSITTQEPLCSKYFSKYKKGKRYDY